MSSHRKYTKEMLQEAVDASVSMAGVLRHLNIPQAGGNHTHVTNMVKRFEIDTSHFTGKLWSKGKTLPLLRKSAEDILVVLPEDSPRPRVKLLRRAMFEMNVSHRCVGINCPNPEPMWAGKPLTLEVDHIDGNWLNNLLENLRFLCPNCHSQEETTNRSWKNK